MSRCSITRSARYFLLFFWVAFCFQPHQISAEPLPAVSWPAGLSDFCLAYLNECYTQCFKKNQHLQDAQGKAYGPRVVGIYCRRICWAGPQRKQICQMNLAQFRTFADEFERKERQKLKEESHEQEKNRQEEALRQQAEKKRLQRLQEQRQEEEERLQAQRQQLEEQKRKLQAQQKAEEQARNATKSKVQEEAKAQQIEIERMRKTLAEQKKAMELQRAMVEEEQKRLALIKKKADERKRLEEERQQNEAKRLAEWERLRLEREKQLEALRKQSEEEKARIVEMRKAAEREKQLDEERKRLAAAQAAEQASAEQQKKAARLAALRRANKALKDKMARLKKRKKRIQEQREAARKNQRKRIERMKRLAVASDHQRKRKIKRPKISRGILLFREGRASEAIAQFEKEGNKDKAEQIKEFQDAYRRGTDAFHRRNANESVPALERAFTLDYDISEGSSNYTPMIRRMLSRMHTIRGMLAMSQREYPAAFLCFSTAHKHDKKNDTVAQQLAKLREVANQNFEQGIQLKSSNPQASRRLMRQVCRIVPRSDPLCKKTQKALEEI